MNDRSIKTLRKIIKDGLRSKYAITEKALSSSIGGVASQLYAKGLISEAVKNNANFGEIVCEFESGLELKSTKAEIEDRCQKFLDSISSEGGPAEECAKALADEWKLKAKKKTLALS